MNLPKGWTQTKFGEISQLQNGRAYKQHELLDAGKYPVLRVGNFFTNPKWYYSNLELEPTKYCDDGDLLYAWSASFGPRIWAGGKVIFHYHIWRVDLEARISDRYFIFQWFNWDKENIKAAHGTGSTMIHVTKGDMEERAISLPPQSEQRRIVAKLDALNARITRARAELDRVPVLAKRFREEALTRCFEFAGSPVISLGDEIQAIESGKNLRCDERPPRDGEKGVVKVSAVTWGRFDETKSKTLPSDFLPPEKSRIKVGDLLISRANTLELVGAPVIVEQQPRNLFLSDKILRLVVSKENKRWILWFLRSPDGRRQIEAMATGNQLSMRNISQDALKKIILPFPAETIRAKRIQVLEHTFARADRLEAEAARARKLLDRLESAILAKAFRGELVPQDPNDEPASVLLERIRAERAAAPKHKRGARKAAHA